MWGDISARLNRDRKDPRKRDWEERGGATTGGEVLRRQNFGNQSALYYKDFPVVFIVFQ